MASVEKSPNLRSHRRHKTSSSLTGMISLEDAVIATREKEVAVYTQTDRQELRDITRKLRRAKRKLLLKSAEKADRPVDQLREILLQLSVDVMMEEDDFSKDSDYPQWSPSSSPSPSFD